MLRYGVFEDFKGATTLLIWGNSSLDLLADLFRDLAEHVAPSARFDEVAWMHGEPGCSVVFNLTNSKRSALRLGRLGQTVSVHCEVTADDLLSFAEKTAVLAVPECGAGHQYLDVLGAQPVQIMLSKGEYPNGWPVA